MSEGKAGPAGPAALPRLATTDFVDSHVAHCPVGLVGRGCWLCATYRRTLPIEYREAVLRGRARAN